MLYFKSVYTTTTLNVFLLIACIFFLGCKKNNVNYGTNNYTFSPNGLAYIQLSTGKYFIYKDSATLTTDSVVVTQSLLDTISGIEATFFGNEKYTAQEYTLILLKIGTSGSTVWLTGKAKSLDDVAGDAYLLPTEFNASGYLFRYPPDSTITTMVVEGNTYADVILTINPVDLSPEQSTYYWAKGVGLIKSSKVDSLGIRKTYTLLRNH